MFRKQIRRSVTAVPAIALLWLAILSSQAWATAAKPSSPTSIAKSQLDAGDIEAAEKTLWGVLSSEPTNEPALLLLGTIRVRQQRYPEAEALFRRVLQLNPKSIAASRSLASCLAAQGKSDDAFRQYEEALRLAPQDSELKIEVARLNVSRGNFADALTLLDTIKPPIPKAALPLKAACLLQLGRKAEAESLIPQGNRSVSSAIELAEVFAEANDPDAALRALVPINSPNRTVAAHVSYLKGRALREKGNLTVAMNNYRHALSLNPKSVEALIGISEILAAEKKHAESFDTLEKAQALAPGSPEILRHFIVEAMQAGENAKALAIAQELQSKSVDPKDRYLAATVMLQQKQFSPASQILEDYTAQHPDDARAYLGLGIAYLNLLRYSDARKALERSLQLKPDFAETEYQLGLCFAQLGSRDEAIHHWEKAISLDPDHAGALFSLGAMYFEAGELEKARTVLERSLTKDSNNMKAEYDLALVLKKLGNSALADEHFQRYRKMQEQEHSMNGNPKQTADRQ